jgi:heme-degrading monooxygenase HmoA
MQHVRVATYKVTKGTPEELAKVAEDGMLPIFKGHHGFIGYSVLKIGDGEVMSISVWNSHKDAEEATGLAKDFVAENMADLISLEWNGVADAMFNANALGD